MKQSAWIAAAAAAWAPWAVAGLFDEVKPHTAKYEYFQAGFVSQPDDFSGLELGGSMPFASNVAVTGRMTLPSATVNGVSVDSKRIELGTRYFFEMPSLDQTDADLGVALANVDVSGGGISESDSAVLLSGQFRRVMNRQIGKSKYAINEAYGGAQVSVGDLTARALHAGLLVDLNEKFSANAELMIDDGAHVRLGIRMDIAKPDAPRRAALMRKKEPAEAADTAVPATAALERDSSEEGNRVMAFIRKLFRQGPDADEADGAPAAAPQAEPLIEATPVFKAAPVTGAMQSFKVPDSK